MRLNCLYESRGVGRGSMPSASKLAVLGRKHDLVVVLDNDQFGKLVPALHHLVGVLLGFAGEEIAELAWSHLGGGLLNFLLVLGVVVFKLFLGFRRSG